VTFVWINSIIRYFEWRWWPVTESWEDGHNGQAIVWQLSGKYTRE